MSSYVKRSQSKEAERLPIDRALLKEEQWRGGWWSPSLGVVRWRTALDVKVHMDLEQYPKPVNPQVMLWKNVGSQRQRI